MYMHVLKYSISQLKRGQGPASKELAKDFNWNN